MERLCEDELGLVLKRIWYPADRKSCSEVCKKWWKIEALTRSSLCVKGDNPKFLTRLFTRYTNLLKFKSYGLISDSDLLLLAHTNPNLQVLDASFDCFSGGFGDDGLCGLANICHNLKKVCLRTSGEVGDRGVIALVQSNPNLTNLDLSNYRITYQALEAIAINAPSLQVLNLRDCCGQITHLGLLALAKGTVKELGLGSWDQFTDQSLEAIATTSLHALDFSNSRGITDSGLAKLANGNLFRTIKKLVLEGCPNITDQSLEPIAAMATSLEHLDLKYCDISDLGLAVLVTGNLCRTLKKLFIASCPSDAITDNGLLFLRQMQCLEELSFHGFGSVTNAGGVAVSAIQTLKTLDLGFIDMSDVTVVALSQKCPNLVNLTLSNCSLITGFGIRSFASHTSLERLVLLSIPLNVSGEDIEHLVLGCQSLRVLYLFRSLKKFMTPTMVENIAKSCTIFWMDAQIYGDLRT